MDPSIAEETRSILQPLFDRPKLTDKLLSKPPFRFLHDIVSNVIASTGYLQGVFGPDEQDAKAMDKHGKISYLEKLIQAVESSVGQRLDVRPSKIVAGHEPEKTNDLLQALGRAAQNTSTQPDEPRAMTQPPATVDTKAPSSNVPVPEKNERRATATPSQGPVFFAPEMYSVNGSFDTTRELLEPIIAKPKLSDKLLGKPPIRFLHDVVMNVKAATGFAEGLYTPEQQNSANVKEKEAKLEFLEKLVNVVGIHLRTKVPAKPAKIVAGLDAENTNILLQLIGIAARHGQMDEAVNRVLAGERQSHEYSDIGSGPAMFGLSVPTTENAAAAQQLPQVASESKHEEIRHDRQGSQRASRKAQRLPETSSQPQSQPERSHTERNQPISQPESKLSEDVNTTEPPPSRDSGLPPTTRTGSASMRPQTARRRPPKVRDASSSGPSSRTTSRQSSAGIRRPGEMPAGVMTEGAADSDSDEERDGHGEFTDLAMHGDTSELTLEGAGRGKHTRDILQAQDKTTGRNGKVEEETKSPDEQKGGIRFGRINKRKDGGGISAQDVDLLRAAIQKLCQSTNPLGKSLEYVKDDLDDMRMELNQWRSEYKQYAEKLQNEQRETEEIIAPYKAKLHAEEEKCEEMKRKITSMKTVTAKNDQQIQELLELVVTRGQPQTQQPQA